ncbi:MAG TPA: hypothetical protein VNE40_01720 [Candidatus Dormibacteraeota bacterium]|nr:hypothetical protein [Candidatus Dormibacteraeota bacterium]
MKAKNTKPKSRTTKQSNLPVTIFTPPKWLKNLSKTTRWRLLIVIFGVVTIIFITRLSTFLQEQGHLNWASERISYIQQHIGQVLGSPFASKRTTFCNHQNQMSDLDIGRLHCGISLVITEYPATNDTISQSSDNLANFLAQNNVFGPWNVEQSTNMNQAFDITNQNLTCYFDSSPVLINENPHINTKPSTTFIISCDTPTSWQYYPVNEAAEDGPVQSVQL